MIKTIIDTISGLEICSKNPDKTVKERLAIHNSTFAYRHRGMHYPANAYAEEQNGVIYIKTRK